jgi:hypothetical protein
MQMTSTRSIVIKKHLRTARPRVSLELLVAATSSFAKLSERKCKFLGIDSPQPKGPDTVNNTVTLMNGVSQEEGLKTLIAYKALQAQNARS